MMIPSYERRRTKIMATLGPATDEWGVLEAMLDEGLDAVRINCSHGTPDDWRRRAAQARAAAGERPLAVLFDLQGPKIRLAADEPARDIERGAQVLCAAARGVHDDALVIEWPDLVHAAVPGKSEIIIGDGTPRFAVTGRREGFLTAQCLVPGRVSAARGAFVTHAERHLPALTEKDRADVLVALAAEADFIALSFVHEAADIDLLRELIGAHPARVVAKIETLAAIENLADITAAADGVMVARGDLGIEAGVPSVPLLQKRIIRTATAAGKMVITATQMLESMIQSPEPTRAEAADVANAILDGTSAVMLSAETATGSYPLEAVVQMDRIALAAQAGVPFSLDLLASGDSLPEAVIQAAVLLGREIKAAALVVPTVTGGSARAAAKYRPRRPILALCHEGYVARQLALEWGVVPQLLPDEELDVVSLVRESLASAADVLHLAPGEPVVLTTGPHVAAAGGTNLIAVHHIGGAQPVTT